ncbi:MAG: GNAT family N-acetyltransferase [Acidobacteria bacterium]|nr:GNAT family N-acetyltransferase [Acidobacteriota bacterium]
MYWRRPRSQFLEQRGPGNKRTLKRMVAAGKPPGLLAYANGQPIGWCALAPRAAYSGLERSRVLKPVDEKPVWSVVCFFVARPYRGRGLTVKLLGAAAAYARKQGARILEGYPVEPKRGRWPDAFAYTGTASAFRRAGFREVARRSATRPLMRRVL